jgi:hypothetical protein
MPEKPPAPTLPEPKNPAGLDLDQSVYNMVWPANRLTYRQMAKLRYVSRLVKLPMNQLIKDAVDVYLAGIQRHLRELIDGEVLPAEASDSESLAGLSLCLVAETPTCLPHSNQSPTVQKSEPATTVCEVKIQHE